jgi:small conductance mechanosensitive channel
MFEQFNKSLGNLWLKLEGWLDKIILALPNLVLALIITAFAFLLGRFLKKVFKKFIRRFVREEAVVSVLSNIFVAVFVILILFIILGVLELDSAVKALLGTAGVAGLAVGLALQDTLVNLFSGMIISLPDSVSMDDMVETNGYFGKISKITLRHTVLLTPTGQEIIIPNKEITQKPMINYTRSGRRRIDIECGIAYKEDLVRVKKIAIEAIENSGLEPGSIQPVKVFFHSFGESSINFTIQFWQKAATQNEFNEDKDRGLIALKTDFDRNGIVIPFPIRTLDYTIHGATKTDVSLPNFNRPDMA